MFPPKGKRDASGTKGGKNLRKREKAKEAKKDKKKGSKKIARRKNQPHPEKAKVETRGNTEGR